MEIAPVGLPKKLPSQRKRRPTRLGPLFLAFVLAACASGDSEQFGGFDQNRAETLFTVGFEDISNFYIDDISISDLAVAGLGSLTSLDPAIDVAEREGQIALTIEGQEIGSYTSPRANDTDGWARVTAAAISNSRSYSQELGASDSEDLYEIVFDGALSNLDGFSRYAGRIDAKQNRENRDGFGGIGVRIRMVEQGVQILSVMDTTPAAMAGFQSQDIITHVNGEPVAGLSQRDAVRRLRGRIHTPVRLTVVREDSEKSFDLTVVRTHIVPQTVSYRREGDIAILRVSSFNQNTSSSLREKIREAQADIKPRPAGYILDLRSNPGGLLEQAVAVSDIFVDSGRIVSTRGRHPESYQYFDADNDDLIDHAPMVVVVNGNSASASEIVASALQDSHRAIVVGSASFGKGTVQTLLRLPNQGELILTWARFHAPSGYALNKRGVLPDVCTTSSLSDTPTIDSVLARLRSGELPIDQDVITRDVAVGDNEGIGALRAHCPSREGEVDLDVNVALRLLQDPGLYALATNQPRSTADLQIAPSE